MTIENIAINNAKNVKIYNIYEIENKDPKTINEAELYIICKNGKISFINSKFPGKRIDMVKEKLNITLDIKTNFCIKLNVHDYCNEKGTLTFGKKLNDDSVLFPDLYQLYNYFDQVIKDSYNFNSKESKIIFAGASTGSKLPYQNNRIKMCIWSLQNEWAKKFTIIKTTNIVQIDKNYLENYLTDINFNINDILTSHVKQIEQLKYKYILSIDGNTYAWDRPVWVMNSNSILFKYTNEDSNYGWYYELLKDNFHYFNIDENTMEKTFNFIENNNKIALNIIDNANEFIQNYCTETAYKQYLNFFFINVGYRF